MTETRDMSHTLQAKTALVTGASRGIGQAIALALGRRGATVIGTATSDAGAASITDLLSAESLSGQGMRLDVRDGDRVKEILKEIERHHGAIQVLVNNAGITRDNLLLRMKEDDWTAIIDTNLTSLYRVTRACLRGMLKNRYGRIINITSVVGVIGNPGQSNYATAKAGVIGFTRSMALELAPRSITVNAIAPGFIDTDMTRGLSAEQTEQLLSRVPLRRLGTVEEITQATAFLASDEAAYITGTTLHVNGGMYMN